MKQQDFEKKYDTLWAQLERYLSLSPTSQTHDKTNRELPALYKAACHHLALARERQYSYQLINRLDQLVDATHRFFYKPRFSYQSNFLRFFFEGFPQAMYENRWYVVAGMLLFFLSFGLTALACYLNVDLIYSVFPAEQVRGYESMYNPENRVLGRERDSETDIQMFGYYIYNNIGIAFRTFATGILLGLGSVFFLVYNGLVIGAVMGYMAVAGYHETFFPFVAGHGSFELTGIALSGAAGLRLGAAFLIPGAYSRLTALRLAANSCIKLMYGVFLMLLMAAFIEAFWSSSTVISNTTKYYVGAGLWMLVLIPLLRMIMSNKRSVAS
jgi:uncharacterized membrane protein SpoIIM required for sporulation